MDNESKLKKIISKINLNNEPENPSNSDTITSQYMYEIYKGHIRTRSENLGVPLYTG